MSDYVHSGVEAVYALTVASHPQLSGFVEQQAVYAVAVVAETMAVERYMPEIVAVRTIAVQSFFCTDENIAVGRFEKAVDKIIAEAEAVVVDASVHFEVQSVETVQAVVGAEPHESAAVLHGGPDAVMRKTVVGLIAAVQRGSGKVCQAGV